MVPRISLLTNRVEAQAKRGGRVDGGDGEVVGGSLEARRGFIASCWVHC